MLRPLDEYCPAGPYLELGAVPDLHKKKIPETSQSFVRLIPGAKLGVPEETHVLLKHGGDVLLKHDLMYFKNLKFKTVDD